MREVLERIVGRVGSVHVARQARWEVALGLRSLRARWSPPQRRHLARLRREGRDDLRVNLGCGPLPIQGWLNVDGLAPQADLIQHLGRRLDLPSGCAAMVFSEHVLEHLDYPVASRTFLAEAFRILRPKGTFRVIVPDAERAARAYVDRDMGLLSRLAPGEETPIGALNKIFRECGFHRFAWDYALLERELLEAGFRSVRRAEFRDSSEPSLNVDLDEEERRAQSLYVEATKG